MTKNDLNDHKKCYVNVLKHIENHIYRQLLQTVSETKCKLPKFFDHDTEQIILY